MAHHSEHLRHFGVHRLATSFAVGLGALSIASAANAADLMVPDTYNNIAVALNNASDGDTIIVGPGLWDDPLDLGVIDVTIMSSAGPDVTTINVFGLDSAIKITGGQSLATVIEGFTITGGSAPAGVGDPGRGGGVYINNASATIRNCRIVGNLATDDPGGDGGGLFIENGDLVLEATVFLNNQCNDVGGAAYFRSGTNVTVTNCHFEGNVTDRGGAVAATLSVTTITDSTFFLNGTQLATEDGGAMWVNNSTVNVDRCRFESNVVFDDGSAIIVENGGDIDIFNSVFFNNMTDDRGAVYAWGTGTTADLAHCTMFGNTGGPVSTLRESDSAVMTFHNGIIWGNTGTIAVDAGVNATYSVIQDGFAGAGNVSIDPLLDPQLNPQPGSPAIDAADTYVLLGDNPLDFNLNPRAVNDPDTADTGVLVFGLAADMGAFELQASVGPTCPGDTTGDSLVNIDDFLQVLGAWGACP